MVEYQQFVIWISKLGLSLGLGLFLGWEREHQKKPAGLRDIALITVGSTIFAILALELVELTKIYEGVIRYDLGRIFAYVIASIGFLGSGVILQNKNQLAGITTAGALWAVVGIGLLVGIGQYSLGIICAIFIYFILKLKHINTSVRRKIRKRRK